jgi:hypothetical protein
MYGVINDKSIWSKDNHGLYAIDISDPSLASSFYLFIYVFAFQKVALTKVQSCLLY